MMDDQLDAWILFGPTIEHASQAEVVTRLAGGSIHRSTYGEVGERAQRLMHALDAMDLAPGDRVATLAWNTFRHLEAYFAVPCTGRVLHTLNLRLSPEELAYIIGHAGDRAILVDPEFLPVLEKIADRLPEMPRIVVLGDVVPDTSLPGVIAYEDLIADQPSSYPRSVIPETTPMGLCYTSGTTGHPKGVLYTHRSSVLHALAVTSAAGMSIGPGDAVLPQVPMFHANAWGMPYAAATVGAKQVFFAGPLEATAFVDLMEGERVTVSAGVPTVWLSVADELARRPAPRLPEIRHIVCGGSQPPRSLITRYRDEFGITIVQAWGMTETSPLASMAWPQERMRDWPAEEVTDQAICQAGLPLPGVRITIRDEAGAVVPSDGQTMGDLWVRGPWVTDGYVGGEGTENFVADGWFRTGDVAIRSQNGYFVIADRTKDLIKSGGEWISSVDMESALSELPGVAEAAVVAVPDPKWQERPFALLVLRPGTTVTREQAIHHLMAKGFAGWQMPEKVQVVEEIPKTATGKIDKKAIRARIIVKDLADGPAANYT